MVPTTVQIVTKLSKKNLFQKGFTLLELLVVIGILGILVSVVSFSFGTAQQRARDSRRQQDLKNVQDALEQYYGEYNAYPNDIALLDTTYLPNGMPKDPKSSTLNYTVVQLTSTTYQICADLEKDGTFTGSNADYCITQRQ